MNRHCERETRDRTKRASSTRRATCWLAAGALCAAVTAAILLCPPAVAAQGRHDPARPQVPPGGLRPVPHVTITPAMVRYSSIRYALYFVDSLAGMLALFLLLRTGTSARLRDLAEARVKNGLLRACIYVPLYLLAYTLLMLPLTLYGSYVLPHQYGLSTQTPGGWVLDE